MTVAKGYTNFNWQLRMLKQQTDCCGQVTTIPPGGADCYCSTPNLVYEPDATINSIAGTDPLGTAFNIVIAPPLSLWDINFQTELATLIDTALGSTVTVNFLHIAEERWSLCISDLPAGYVLDNWEITIDIVTDNLPFTPASDCDTIPPQGPLEMEYFSEFSEPFDSMGDPNDVEEWNNFYGIAFTNVVVLPPDPFTFRTTVRLYGGVYRGVNFLANQFSFGNIYRIDDAYEYISSIEAGCFAGLSIETFASNYLPVIPDNAFVGSSLVSIFCPNTLTIESRAFRDAYFLVNYVFTSVTSIESLAFADTISLTTLEFPSVVTIGDSAFLCGFANPNLFLISLPACTSLGATSGDDNVFFNRIGSPYIDCFFNTVLATNDGGNPDGDIQYLAANNTTIIIYL